MCLAKSVMFTQDSPLFFFCGGHNYRLNAACPTDQRPSRLSRKRESSARFGNVLHSCCLHFCVKRNVSPGDVANGCVRAKEVALLLGTERDCLSLHIGILRRWVYFHVWERVNLSSKLLGPPFATSQTKRSLCLTVLGFLDCLNTRKGRLQCVFVAILSSSTSPGVADAASRRSQSGAETISRDPPVLCGGARSTYSWHVIAAWHWLGWHAASAAPYLWWTEYSQNRGVLSRLDWRGPAWQFLQAGNVKGP